MSALPQSTTTVAIGDSANQAVLVGVGPVGSEVIQMVIPSSSSTTAVLYPLQIPANARVSLKSTTGTVTSGENDMSFFH